MKSIGIVRKLDELGRIVIPIELRRRLNIHPKDVLEIFTVRDSIFIKNQPTCIFCAEAKNIYHFKGKNICPKCMEDIIKNRE